MARAGRETGPPANGGARGQREFNLGMVAPPEQPADFLGGMSGVLKQLEGATVACRLRAPFFCTDTNIIQRSQLWQAHDATI